MAKQRGFPGLRGGTRRGRPVKAAIINQGNIVEPQDTINITASDGQFDPKNNSVVIIDMDQNLTSLSLTQKEGLVDGDPLMILFDQDPTGSRTVTFDGSDFQATLSTPLPTLSGTADTRDLTAWVWNASAAKFSCVAHSLEAIL